MKSLKQKLVHLSVETSDCEFSLVGYIAMAILCQITSPSPERSNVRYKTSISVRPFAM